MDTEGETETTGHRWVKGGGCSLGDARISQPELWDLRLLGTISFDVDFGAPAQHRRRELQLCAPPLWWVLHSEASGRRCPRRRCPTVRKSAKQREPRLWASFPAEVGWSDVSGQTQDLVSPRCTLSDSMPVAEARASGALYL